MVGAHRAGDVPGRRRSGFFRRLICAVDHIGEVDRVALIEGSEKIVLAVNDDYESVRPAVFFGEWNARCSGNIPKSLGDAKILRFRKSNRCRACLDIVAAKLSPDPGWSHRLDEVVDGAITSTLPLDDDLLRLVASDGLAGRLVTTRRRR